MDFEITMNKTLSRLGIGNFRRRLSDWPYVRAIASDTFIGARVLYRLMTLFHRSEFLLHRKYLSGQSKQVTETLEDMGLSPPSKKIKVLLTEADLGTRFSAIDWSSPEVDKYKPWMWYCDPTFDGKLVKLITEIADELSGYLNGLPVLQSAYFWRSIPLPNDAPSMGSQDWHMDNNDLRQIRVFIALNNIDESNGALEYVSTRDSKDIYSSFNSLDRYNRRNKKRTQQEFAKFEFLKKSLCLNNGETFYIDVGNCYHRGSRKMLTERHVFVLQFMSPFHIDSKIVKRTSRYGINEELLTSEKEKLVFKYYGGNYLKSSKNSKSNSLKWLQKLNSSQRKSNKTSTD